MFGQPKFESPRSANPEAVLENITGILELIEESNLPPDIKGSLENAIHELTQENIAVVGGSPSDISYSVLAHLQKNLPTVPETNKASFLKLKESIAQYIVDLYR